MQEKKREEKRGEKGGEKMGGENTLVSCHMNTVFHAIFEYHVEIYEGKKSKGKKSLRGKKWEKKLTLTLKPLLQIFKLGFRDLIEILTLAVG